MAIQAKSKESFVPLYECCKELTKKDGLIEFMQGVRGRKNDMSGKNSIKQADLANLFSRKLWIEEDKGGHRKLKNAVTGIVVEYANHNKTIDLGAVVKIVEQVQKHANILHNDIFGLTKRGWPQDLTALDYKAALNRLNQSNSNTRPRSSSAS